MSVFIEVTILADNSDIVHKETKSIINVSQISSILDRSASGLATKTMIVLQEEADYLEMVDQGAAGEVPVPMRRLREIGVAESYDIIKAMIC